MIDEIVTVREEEANAGAKTLAGEGYPCGISSGAAYHAAREIALARPGKQIVTLLPDSADRYLSLGLLD